MMKRGDANMKIREATLRYPTKICRERESKYCKLMNTTPRKSIRTDMLSPTIFSWSKVTVKSEEIMQKLQNTYQPSND